MWCCQHACWARRRRHGCMQAPVVTAALGAHHRDAVT
jgi:hypothetical protein